MVQVGTKSLPIRITPRIGGLVVTQTEIETIYSNFFVDQGSTPLTWVFEYKAVDGTIASISFDAGLSGPSSIYFPIPDSFYANKEEWTFSVAWQIATEKIYMLRSVKISVVDEHNR